MTKSRVFSYKNQTRIVRRLRDWRKIIILFMIGADLRHIVFLANAELTPKIRRCSKRANLS
jgi:hypothetical protein